MRLGALLGSCRDILDSRFIGQLIDELAGLRDRVTAIHGLDAAAMKGS
jgi:hypothetical protein